MDVRTAIITLEELIGREVEVNRGVPHADDWEPYFVVTIDHFAAPEFRCVVGCTYPNGSRYLKRRAVVQVTVERKYSEAEAAIAGATPKEIGRGAKRWACDRTQLN